MYLAECHAEKIVVQPSRKMVERLEAYLLQTPEVEILTEHRFAPGVYIRQITIPAGITCTGAACKQEHLSVMVRGYMVAYADGAMRDIKGYNEWIAPAGVKRVGTAIEETVWFTVHPNPDDTRDLNVLESRLWEQADMLQRRRAADGLIQFQEAPCLLS